MTVFKRLQPDHCILEQEQRTLLHLKQRCIFLHLKGVPTQVVITEEVSIIQMAIMSPTYILLIAT